MSGIKLLLILVIAVLIVVLFKYVQIKRQIRNLSKQMTDLTTGKSEKMLDISLVDKDIEQLAAVLNQYNEKQRQSIASTLRHEMYLKESIANISHDLRTPLTVILGHLQLLKKENLSAGQTQRIETIYNKAERMKALIQTFYDVSVIDANKSYHRERPSIGSKRHISCNWSARSFRLSPFGLWYGRTYFSKSYYKCYSIFLWLD